MIADKVLDYEGVLKDKDLISFLQKGQSLILSALVDKYNHVNKRQTRTLVVTDRAVYNFASKSIMSIFKSRLRRRISYSIIYGMTVSRHGSEFHDYRMSSAKYKLDFVESICRGFCKYHKSEMPCFYKDDIALTIFTTTIDDKKKGLKRMPNERPIMLNPQTITKSDQTKGSSKLVFRHKKDKSSQEVSLQEFKLVKTLGRGAFGKVMLCEKQDSKQLFAVKSLRKQNLISTSSVDKVMTERKLLQAASHPFVISLQYAFQTKQKIFFVMRFVRGGELYHHLKKMKRFKEEMAKFYAAQMILAINYIHEQGFVYRDIKPQNILLGEDGYILVSDFGLAKALKKKELTFTTVGTPQYMAPQIINREGHNHMVDWWSLGILIYEMTQGRSPFFHGNQNKVYQNIVNAQVYFNYQDISAPCKDIIKGFLVKNPVKRLGVNGLAQLQQQKWFQGMDWQALLQKKLKPPFIPDLKSDRDLNNFDTAYTKEQALNSVVEKPDMLLLKKFERDFDGMSYMPE